MLRVADTAASITVNVSEAESPFPLSLVVSTHVPAATCVTLPFASTVATFGLAELYVNGPTGATWFPDPFAPSNSKKAGGAIVQLGTGEFKATLRGIVFLLFRLMLNREILQLLYLQSCRHGCRGSEPLEQCRR